MPIVSQNICLSFYFFSFHLLRLRVQKVIQFKFSNEVIDKITN